jgi:hypothetical protein
MFRMDVDLLEMSGAGLEHLDVGKSHRSIVRKGDPEVTMTSGLVQLLPAGRLGQHGLRRVARKKLRRCELYGRK